MMRGAALALWVFAAHALHVERGWQHGRPASNVTGPNAPWRMDLHDSQLGRQLQGHNLSYPRQGFVNLTLPPRERWKDMVTILREEFVYYIVEWNRILTLHTEIDQGVWAEAVRRKMKSEHYEELLGIVEAASSPAVTVTNMLLFQAMYEMGSPMACAEVVAATEDGQILHGRNLDYRLISPVVEVVFYKDDEPFIMSSTYVGKVGFLTAMKSHYWSFGMNTRFVSNDTHATALGHLQADGFLAELYVRELMEKPFTYSEALAELEHVPLCKDVYFVLGGAAPYEGSVIARAASPKFQHTNKLFIWDYGLNTRTWYLFQTNDDLSEPPMDGRRGAGIGAMNALRQENVNPSTLLNIMHSPPIHTPILVVTFMMAPRSGLACTVLGPMATTDDQRIDTVKCSLAGWNHLNQK